MPTRLCPARGFAFLFFLSGFAGVLVEQIFERLLSVLVGGSTPASALVLGTGGGRGVRLATDCVQQARWLVRAGAAVAAGAAWSRLSRGS